MRRWLESQGWWPAADPTRRERTSGYPTSSNRASSSHLRWGGLPARVPLVAAVATLEVIAAPQVAELYFWALQVAFTDRGRRTGGAHLGLQWHPGHPGSTAVNWGGYGRDGGELSGSTSTLPSATGNANTRDLAWPVAGRHRLAVTAGPESGTWTGWVDGLAVRHLAGGGTELSDLMVWSEVFARCDDPSVAVRWSDLRAQDGDGRWHRPDRVTVSYQSRGDGGCDSTNVEQTADGLVQRTNTLRTVPAGTNLRLDPG